MKLNINTQEAKGEIEVVETTYGANIFVNGKFVAMIDLFYLSDEVIFGDVNLGDYFDEDEIKSGIAVRNSIEDESAQRIVILSTEKTGE